MERIIIKIICGLLLFVVIFSFININNVYCATKSKKATETTVLNAMKGVKNQQKPDGIGKIGTIINTAIGFIQITGTGISVIMVSVLGIKYMLASPGDKADVKKQIAPLVIGAVILFASVNIIQIVADFSATLPTS